MVDWAALFVILSLVVLAAALSLWLGLSAAIVELVLGMIAANFLGVTTVGQDWMAFLAGVGSVVLTFLAGAEIDPAAFRKTWKASVAIGLVSFLAPFLAAWTFTWVVLAWTFEASLIAGVALSTTSVAVVYVVLVESGMSRTDTGKLILSSCFVTDLGTAVALSTLFVRPNVYIIVLIVALAVCTLTLPRAFAWLFSRLRDRGGELPVKLTLLLVAGLAALATLAGSHAVLPAYVLGLLLAAVYGAHRDVLLKVRTIALAFLTPFFFLNAGMNVSLAAVVTGASLVALLFVVKVGAKFAGVLPLSWRFARRDAVYTTLLMSTGLTFGTISAQYGLSAGIIDRTQFSVLVMVVLLTAILPTVVAQKWFHPASPERRSVRAQSSRTSGEARGPR